MPRIAVALLLAASSCTCGGALQSATAGVDVPPLVTLPTVFEDEEAVAVVPIRSTGTGAIQVVALTPVGVTLDALALPSRLGGGGVLEVTVRWSPGGVATLDGSLDVTTDQAPDAPVRVRLAGTALEVPACDDGNPCTDDTFDRNLRRCVSAPHDRACDDGSACTGNDRCDAGTCRGTALRCDDDDVCTLDFCDPARGCVHPPDPATCDDGDPCTADVCDREAGCSHPNAPDGTACGPFSCGEANLCVFGTCRPLDVRGASDGFPCFDGDLCTADDACDAGVCVGGPRLRSEPMVKGELVTFGGAGHQAATDGERWLFVAPTHLVLTERDASGQLRVTGRLPGIGFEFPVAVGAGRFVLARSGRLVVLDARDPANLQVTSDFQVLAATGATSIANVLAAPGGVYVHARDDGFAQQGLALFVPLSPAFEPGLPLRLPLGNGLRLFDADANTVAWVDAQQVAWWARLDANGNVTSAGQAFSPTGAPVDVAVEGSVLAVRGGDDFVGLHELGGSGGQPVPCTDAEADVECASVGPSCAGAFPWPAGNYRTCNTSRTCGDPAFTCLVFTGDTCPNCDIDCDAECCTEGTVSLCATLGATQSLGIRSLEGVTDLTISDRALLWTSAAGLHAETIPQLLGPPVTLESQRIDVLPFERLRRSGTHVVASGPIAMPYERANDAEGQPTWRRISGTGHGDVQAIVDSNVPTEVVVAGRSSLGAVDLLTMQPSRWDVIPTLPLPAIVRGPTRSARLGPPTLPEPSAASEGNDEEPPSCAGTDTLVLHADGTTRTPYRLCGAQFGQRVAVADDLLWVDPPSGLLGQALDRSAPMAYRLEGADALLEPVHRTSEVTGDWYYVDLRGEDTGRGVMSIRLPDDVDAPVELAGHTTGSAEAAWVARPGASRRDLPGISFASEGAHLLVSSPTDLRLLRAWPDGGTASSTPDLLATLPLGSTALRRVEWMGRGRAWLSAQRGHETRPGSESSAVEQYAYDPATAALVADGQVELPGAVRSVVDAGVVTLVATDVGLSVVAPACR